MAVGAYIGCALLGLAQKQIRLHEACTSKYCDHRWETGVFSSPVTIGCPQNKHTKKAAHMCLCPQTIADKPHLREALLEVVVQDVRLLRHNRQRDVVSHAERALLSALRHVGDLRSNRVLNVEIQKGRGVISCQHSQEPVVVGGVCSRLEGGRSGLGCHSKGPSSPSTDTINGTAVTTGTGGCNRFVKADKH